MERDCVVYVVDDDPSVRKSLTWLLESANYCSQAYDSAQDFLDNYKPEISGCLLLDVRMPGASGLELQTILENHNISIPIIFISGHVNVKLASEAFRAGACDVLTKPVDVNLLLERVEEAIETDKQQRVSRDACEAKQNQLNKLTSKEKEVFHQLLKGRTIKQLAAHFTVSFQTAAKHRSRILDKLCVDTDAQLIQTFQDVFEEE